MTIGGSLALIIIGAILAYAVDIDISGIDLRVVGIILMIGGLVGLIIGIVRLSMARRRVPPPVRQDPYYEDPPRRPY
ncbi:DUF6458 family protein [Actinomadura sp. 9N407]|uniref:DUF6458 family protein n=1 Tax=Actinomadura sp. 9N407 TaxID=3375154 RepID=UPI00379DC2B2